jgi:hypothetical protein
MVVSETSVSSATSENINEASKDTAECVINSATKNYIVMNGVLQNTD